MSSYNLQRFLAAQEQAFPRALAEIRNGRKISHWMWFVFPQLTGLGNSETAKYYAIRDIKEAAAYLAHTILGPRLIEITSACLQHKYLTAIELFGHPDNLKLHSSVTLFASVENAPTVFSDVIDQYFAASPDEQTLKLLHKGTTK